MKNKAIDYESLYEQSLMTIAKNEEQITQLSFELDKFRRYIFGNKSEKLPSFYSDLDQISLFDLSTSAVQQEEFSEQVEAETTPEKKTAKKRPKGTGRMILPEELRREEIYIAPKEDITDCTIIGEDVTEVLDLIPAEFYVKRYDRRKYARPNGGGIITGQLPERVIEKGIPSNAVIAHMILDKYVYGLPLHRQIDKYRRLGVTIPASTASDWMIKGWKHLAPLWNLLELLIINQKYLQADESPIKVQDKKHKKGIHKGYMWVYHAPADKLVLFDYQKGRDSSGPKKMLEDFSGILQTDGYGVYESLYGKHSNIALIYCMAHARRKFVDALKYDKEKSSHVVAQMQLLYKLEQQMRDEKLSWKQRTELRQKQAVPILNKIEDWLKENAMKVLPKSPLGQAIAYTLPR